MKRIKPIDRGSQGEAVVNLHEVLTFLLERADWQQVAVEERQELVDRLREEEDRYLDYTDRVVSLFQLEAGIDPPGYVDDRTAQALNKWLDRYLEPVPPEPVTGGFRIAAIFPDGSPAAGVLIVLARRGFGGVDTEVARAHVSDGGLAAFDADVAAGQFVLSATDGERSTPISGIVSAAAPDTPPPVFVVPAEFDSSSADEFTRLLTDVSVLAGGQLATARQDPDRTDVQLLSSATGWDGRLVALAANSLAATAPDGLSAAAHYALARAGLPTRDIELAGLTPEVATQALQAAVDAGVVSVPADELGGFVEVFRRFSVETRLRQPAPASRASYADFLREAGIGEQDQKLFASTAFDATASAEDLWQRARDVGVSTPAIRKLSLQGKLAHLTSNNGPLTAHLMDRLTDDPAELVDLGFAQEGAWLATIRTLASPDADPTDEQLAALLPEAPWDHRPVTDRLAEYDARLSRALRIAYPTRVLTSALIDEADAYSLGAARPAAATLMRAAVDAGFELGSASVTNFLSEHDHVLAAVDDDARPSALEAMKALHRTYQLSPSDSVQQSLLKSGFTSAFDIVQLGPHQFGKVIRPTAGSPEVVQLVYNKAQQIASTTYGIFAIAATAASDPALPMLAAPPVQAGHPLQNSADSAVVRQFPTLDSLLGTTDYCECADCRSILSPAAYLVDLFQFLDRAPISGPAAGIKPLDVLFKRRPDLPELLLDCENTNTLLPYIDIASEIMEFDVAHPNQALAGLPAFNTGDVASADLIAEPHHLRRDAYEQLTKAPYPMVLPYDEPAHEIREHLEQVKIPTAALLRTFRTSRAIHALDKIDATAVAAEALGFTRPELNLLADPNALATWWRLYGFDSAAAAEAGNIRSAPVLAQRLGVSYGELTSLITTSFVNPALNALAKLRRVGLAVRDIAAAKAALADNPNQALNDFAALYKLSHPTAKAIQTGAQQAIASFALTHNLPEAEIQNLVRNAALNEAIVIADGDAGDSFASASLTLADGTAVPPEVFLRLVWLVRMWRRLDWPIATIDSLLRSLTPLTGAFDPDGMAASPLLTAIVAFDQVEQVRETLGLPESARLGLIALWTTVDAVGADSFYRTQLLTRTSARPDPELDNPLGVYFATQPRIKDHLPALQAMTRLTAPDIATILADADVAASAPLTMQVVSLLYRHQLLSDALGIDVPTLRELCLLTGLDPFRPLEPVAPEHGVDDLPFHETIQFAREAARYTAGPIELETLEYLATHRQPGEATPGWEAAPTLPEEVDHVLATIATGNREILSRLALAQADTQVGPPELTPLLGQLLPTEVVQQVVDCLRTPLADASGWQLFDDYLLARADGAGFLTDSHRTLFEPGDNLDARCRALHNAAVLALRRAAQEQLVTRVLTVTAPQPLANGVMDALLTDASLWSGVADAPPQAMDVLAATGVAGATDPTILDSTTAVAGTLTRAFFVCVAVAGRYRLGIRATGAGVRASIELNGATHLPDRELTVGATEWGTDTAPVELVPGRLHRVDVRLSGFDTGTAEVHVQGSAIAPGPANRLVVVGATEVEPAVQMTLRTLKALSIASALKLRLPDVQALYGSALRLVDLPVHPNPLDTEERRKDAVRAVKGLRALADYVELQARTPAIAGALPQILLGLLRADEQGSKDARRLFATATKRSPELVAGADRTGAEDSAASPIERAIERIRRWLAVCRASEVIGGQPDQLSEWLLTLGLAGADGFAKRWDAAASIREVTRTRLGPGQFRGFAHAVNDKLRTRRRDALVAHLVHTRPDIANANQLYETYLIDPAMEPVVQTSRIRLAIASVQLFVQRCLMGFEPNVPAAAIVAPDEWEWFSRYRVWEANRKIFLRPENWLIPELRDGKSAQFAELESALLEGDTSARVVEDAFLGYLQALETLARLEIVSLHIQQTQDYHDNVIHVVARTVEEPHQWFTRSYSHGMWSPWEAVTAKITGDHVVPVWWRDHLHIFWFTFLIEPTMSGTMSGGQISTTSFPDALSAAKALASNKIRMQLNWSSLDSGRWSPTRSGPFRAMATVDGTYEFPLSFDVNDLMVSTRFTDESETEIEILLRPDTGKTLVNSGFRLAGRNATPEAVASVPTASEPYGKGSIDATRRWYSAAPLSVSFTERITTAVGGKSTASPVTKPIFEEQRTYSLVRPSNRLKLPVGNSTDDPVVAALEASGAAELASLTEPFFYADRLQTFLIQPSVTETSVRHWKQWVVTPPKKFGGLAMFKDWQLVTDLVAQKPAIPKKYLDDLGVHRQQELLDRVHTAALIPPAKKTDWLSLRAVAVSVAGVAVGADGSPTSRASAVLDERGIGVAPFTLIQRIQR